jgi:Zn-finger nucleic acid-binding protein
VACNAETPYIHEKEHKIVKEPAVRRGRRRAEPNPGRDNRKGRETSMKCPNCDKDLVQTKRDRIEVEYCPSCRGMWLSRQELEELEDEAFDLGEDKKGTMIFSATVTTRKCPQCGKLMKRFEYRLYDLEMDFCEDGHGFWLDADEDKRVPDLMKKEEAGLERKVLAEDRWASHLQHLRSGSFLDRVRDLFR